MELYKHCLCLRREWGRYKKWGKYKNTNTGYSYVLTGNTEDVRMLKFLKLIILGM